ncbi:hypothetical protein EVAR_87127_1 [Eumeta japonica]|uniref:Uncharacterized protein n=1 Tax=Eumeta variegata TaxID=151549 RepID=A0A4C1VTT8_EUMVA|nr:hypothetical protein EVAR_87127_1 [Eumeta japonica]
MISIRDGCSGSSVFYAFEPEDTKFEVPDHGGRRWRDGDKQAHSGARNSPVHLDSVTRNIGVVVVGSYPRSPNPGRGPLTTAVSALTEARNELFEFDQLKTYSPMRSWSRNDWLYSDARSVVNIRTGHLTI